MVSVILKVSLVDWLRVTSLKKRGYGLFTILSIREKLEVKGL